MEFGIGQQKNKMEDLHKNYKLSATYSQDKDGNDSGEDYHFLDIEMTDCGGGPYLLIKTERWAIDMDKIDEFRDILKEFKEKFEKL